MTHFWCVM